MMKQPSPSARTFAARVAAVVVATLVGFLIGGRIGAITGLVFGLFYVWGVMVAAGNYVLDLHGGEVFDVSLAPDLAKSLRDASERLGIDLPAIYEIDLRAPQVCVSATGRGRRARGRIGISRALLSAPGGSAHLLPLMHLAMARIWSGEASVLSIAAAMAGLPLQLAQSRWVNGASADSGATLRRDAECGLSAAGKALLVLFAPASRLTLTLSDVAASVLRSDAAAARVHADGVMPHQISDALRWLSRQQSRSMPPPLDPVTVYNPAEAACYLVSPFDEDYLAGGHADELPLWKRCRFLVTGVVPSLEMRLERLRSSGVGVAAGEAIPPGSPLS